MGIPPGTPAPVSDSQIVFGRRSFSVLTTLASVTWRKSVPCGELLPYEAFRVSVVPTLPGVVRFTEVSRRHHGLGHGFVAGEFRAIVGLASSPSRLLMAARVSSAEILGKRATSR